MLRNIKLSVSLLFMLICLPPLAGAQQPSIEELVKRIEALTQSVQAMQKDVQEIKAMLQSRIAPTPPQKVVLDLVGRPSRGIRRSLNPEYADIEVSEADQFEIKGVVLHMAEGPV